MEARIFLANKVIAVDTFSLVTVQRRDSNLIITLSKQIAHWVYESALSNIRSSEQIVCVCV